MRVRRSGLALFAVVHTAACSPLPPVEPVEPRRGGQIDYEESLPSPEQARIEIIDLQEIPEPEVRRVRIAGTLVNQGSIATTQISIKVRAVDGAGNVIASIYGVPTTQNIPPGGSTAFTAWFDDSPQIQRYHVEAIAR
jgi:hypothetical protein